MKRLLILLLLASCQFVNGQTQEKVNQTVGFEIDALPYIAGGFYASAWYGRNHMRYRAVITKITTPEFVLKEGFKNNDMFVYAAITEYFFKQGFEGWWVGTGLEYWDAEIQTDLELSTAEYKNYIFTIGSGYAWKFYKNFYLNPWAAVHIRFAGDSEVPIDGRIFEPSPILPEVSVKLGWHF